MMSTFQLFLQQLAVICKKEILSIWQDPATRRIVVIPCILMGFLFGYAANYNLENAPYVVLDQSRSGASADLLSRFDGTSLFHRVATVSNANEIAPYIEQEKAVMAISIPQDFQDRLDQGEKAPVQIISDGRNTMVAGLVTGYAGRIVNSFNQERTGVSAPVTVITRTWYNPNQITRWFFMPGIIGLLSFAQVFVLAGLSVAREREEGTFEQLLVAPVSPSVILIGKAMPPMIVGFIQCTILFCISYFWFNVPFAGNFGMFYTAIFFYVLSSLHPDIGLRTVSVPRRTCPLNLLCLITVLFRKLCTISLRQLLRRKRKRFIKLLLVYLPIGMFHLLYILMVLPVSPSRGTRFKLQARKRRCVMNSTSNHL